MREEGKGSELWVRNGYELKWYSRNNGEENEEEEK